jgi:hypothetical protein
MWSLSEIGGRFGGDYLLSDRTKKPIAALSSHRINSPIDKISPDGQAVSPKCPPLTQEYQRQIDAGDADVLPVVRAPSRCHDQPLNTGIERNGFLCEEFYWCPLAPSFSELSPSARTSKGFLVMGEQNYNSKLVFYCHAAIV